MLNDEGFRVDRIYGDVFTAVPSRHEPQLLNHFSNTKLNPLTISLFPALPFSATVHPVQ